MRFRPGVDTDLREASNWYEEQQPRWGEKFLDRVDEAFDRIELQPQLYGVVENGVRRVSVEQFPYSVYYRIDDLEVLILAVVHDRRHRRIWKRRQKDR